MTRQDFEVIARAIAEVREQVREARSPDYVLDSLVDEFARVLVTINPRFDRARFRAACGYTSTYDPWDEPR